MSFCIDALDPAPFLPLFSMPDVELATRGAQRVTATRNPGFPCRVSLADAEVGEELVLVHFEHQPAATPFRASHAIYIRRDAVRAVPVAGEIPQFLRSRTLSLRAFSAEGMIVSAELVRGAELEEAISRLLGLESAAYLHLHNAAMGCYLARAERA